MDNTGHSFPEYDGELYATYRPNYPETLIKYLADLCEYQEMAWDVCTGTGKVAVMLSKIFNKVIASDCSISQLSNAIKKINIEYRCEDIREANLRKGSVDLITVAQAFHWLDENTFLDKAYKILKNNGLLAIWNYSYCLNNQVEDITQQYLKVISLDKDEKARKMLYEGYKINNKNWLPIIPHSQFSIKESWRLSDYFGYLESISTAQQYKEKYAISPIGCIYEEACKIWRNKSSVVKLEWPIHLYLFKKYV